MVPAPRPKTSFEHYARTIELKARDAEFYMDEGMNFTAVEAIRAIEGMKFEAATQRERTVLRKKADDQAKILRSKLPQVGV